MVEVRRKVDPTKLTQGPGYHRREAVAELPEHRGASLLQVIADFTNFNIVTSDSVTGAVTLRLKDVPWDQALDIILQAKGLGMRKSGNVLWIAPKDEIAAKEKLDLEARAAIQSLEPLRTQSFQLNYTKADHVGPDWAPAPAAAAHRASSAPRQRDRRAAHQPAVRHRRPVQAGTGAQLIAKLDIAVRQVLIEARIVEASDTFGKSLGVRSAAVDLRGNPWAALSGYSGRQPAGVATGTYDAVSAHDRPDRRDETSFNTNTQLREPAFAGAGGHAPPLRGLAVQRRRPTAS